MLRGVVQIESSVVDVLSDSMAVLKILTTEYAKPTRVASKPIRSEIRK
jgi:hypothetical protein